MANTIDPQNRVVRYCVEGTEREQEGRHAEALRLFMLAWNQSKDAFERTIAAHYVARHQTTPERALHWNQESLINADTVGNDRVREENLMRISATSRMPEDSMLWPPI